MPNFLKFETTKFSTFYIDFHYLRSGCS